MAIKGAIPSIEEVITNNTILNGEIWTTIPSAVIPLASAGGADAFGVWVQIVAPATYPGQFIRPTQLLPILIPNDATYEVEFGSGPAASEVPIAVARFRRFTNGGVTMLPLAQMGVTAPRINNTLNGLHVRGRCSIAGPINFDIQAAFILYPIGV